MRVKDCQGCTYCERYVWSHSYKPKDYHAIGMSHAFHWCDKYEKRCLEVKSCEGKLKNEDWSY